MPTNHSLKCYVERFTILNSGKATADIRYNDRNFKEGDTILYMEGTYSEGIFAFTGRTFKAKITYVDTWCVEKGYVVLSITKIE